MRNSIKDVKDLLIKGENLSTEQLTTIKGGACGTPTDPKRCK
jgi:hypothetical protein